MSEQEESLIQQLIKSQQELTQQLGLMVQTNQELVTVNQELIATLLDDEGPDPDAPPCVDLSGRPI